MAPSSPIHDPPDRIARRPLRVDSALIRQHQLGVWRYLRFLGSPPELADELCQEVFVILLEAELEERGEAPLRSWLRGVARNLYRAAHRSPRPGLQHLDEAALEAAWQSFDAGDQGNTYLEALRLCLARLTPAEASALQARYGEDHSRAELATRHGLGLEGTRSLLRRGRAKLKACIERRMRHED